MTTEELFLQSVAAYLNNQSLSVSQREEIRWHALMNLSQEQKLLPAVFEVLHESMPESIVSEYRPRVILQVARQTAHTAEFLQIYNQLRHHGFEPLVVKGIIARTTYDRPDFRVSADEDLYLPREEYLRFHQQMQALGFSCSDKPDMDNAHEERYLRHDFLIEGHWELFPQENDALNSLNTYTDGFWSRAQWLSLEGGQLKTLAPTDHMTFLLLHAFKHFISSGFGVRQVCDIAQWSKCYDIQWTDVLDCLQSVHAELFASAVFGIGERYFGMLFPEVFPRMDYEPLLRDILSSGIYGTSTMSRKHSSTMTLGAVESRFHDRASISLLSSLFPNRSVMEMSFPWLKDRPHLLPVSWGIRISRYLKNRGTGNTASEAIRIGNERKRLLEYYRIL